MKLDIDMSDQCKCDECGAQGPVVELDESGYTVGYGPDLCAVCVESRIDMLRAAVRALRRAGKRAA